VAAGCVAYLPPAAAGRWSTGRGTGRKARETLTPPTSQFWKRKKDTAGFRRLAPASASVSSDWLQSLPLPPFARSELAGLAGRLSPLALPVGASAGGSCGGWSVLIVGGWGGGVRVVGVFFPFQPRS
jgi:hypothetical protein